MWNDNLKVTNLEMCNVLNVATKGALIGAQRVRTVWQIYVKNLDTMKPVDSEGGVNEGF